MLELRARSGNPRFAFLGLHGAFLDARSLLEIGTILSAEADGLLVDLAGHGEALEVAATGLTFDPESLGAELWARPRLKTWLAAQPPGLPLVLLGHSLGGLTAIWLANLGPLQERVAHLILLEPLLAIDLSVPGHGEFLFSLGGELGLQGFPRRTILETPKDCMVDRLVKFLSDLFRSPLVGEAERPYRSWLRQLAGVIPCEVLCGTRHHVVHSSDGTLLDIGTLVGPSFLPLDRPLLRLHPVSHAGHRLDTSANAHQLIAAMLPEIARLGPPLPSD
jgi:pimeloyl-ACP methyl ester carboxylesterase